MQIRSSLIGPQGSGGQGSNPDLARAAAVVNDTSGAHSLETQLQAYQTVASYWGQPNIAAHDRDAMVQAVTDSPFARRVEGVLNAFSKAAWAGDGASEAQAHRKMLGAFNALSGADQHIVATIQSSARGRLLFSSTPDYKAHLEAQANLSQSLESAAASGRYRPGADPASIEDPALSAAVALSQVHPPRDAVWTRKVEDLLRAPAPIRDTVTLSPQARDLLARGAAPGDRVQRDPAAGSLTLTERAALAAARAYAALDEA